jgi:hypothetical protein
MQAGSFSQLTGKQHFSAWKHIVSNIQFDTARKPESVSSEKISRYYYKKCVKIILSGKQQEDYFDF